MQRALEAAGVEFTNGEHPGVRLTKAVEASFIKRHIALQSQKRFDSDAVRRPVGDPCARAIEKPAIVLPIACLDLGDAINRLLRALADQNGGERESIQQKSWSIRNEPIIQL